MKEHFVLLPGWTRTLRTYSHFFETAPEGIELEFIDYQKIIPDGDLEKFPERLNDYLRQKGVGKISLVGFSLGGALGFEFSLKYPELVKTLYLVNAAGIYGKESVFEVIKNQTKNLLERRGSKTVRSISNSNVLSTNPLLNIKLGLYAHKVDVRGKKIPRSFPPTFIFWGGRDVVHPLWQGREFQKLIPKSKLIPIKGGGHDWLVYSPEKFWDQVVNLCVE